jgi:outer membrane lipoprotein SlyB
MRRLLNITLIFSAIFFLAACQPNINSNDYGYEYYYGAGGSVREGVVQDIQYNVVVQGQNTGTGSMVGGFTGAVVGSSMGGSGIGSVIGTIGGAVVGSLAGNAIEQSSNEVQGTLYIVRLAPKGRLISVIQQDPIPLCVGDHVYVIMNVQNPRIRLNGNYYENPAHTREGCINQ